LLRRRMLVFNYDVRMHRKKKMAEKLFFFRRICTSPGSEDVTGI
jgi:hypothetical protein